IDFLQLWRLNPKFLNNTKFITREMLFFNRVPKTGSETLNELMRKLGPINGFRFDRAPFKSPIGMRWPLERQRQEAEKFIEMADGDPFAYVEHVNYFDFRQFHLPQPIYINMVRDPVEKVLSWYYYKRTPWHALLMFDGYKKFQSRAFYRKSFESCIMTGDPECNYEYGHGFDGDAGDHRRQSLFFCGHAPICEPFNTPGAIQRAKQNVERDFAVVGSWEDVNVTLAVLEHYIPRFFRGVTDLYYEPKGLAYLPRNTNHWKPHISEKIKNMMRPNFTQEYDFYYFCKQRLYRQYFAINHHLEL
ncbi:uncharacterized protein Dwil_GK19555, partial [Drosophila willistoni]